MKKIIFLTILILSSSEIFAQRIHAYVTSGLALSQIEGDELKGFEKAGFTGSVGAFANLTESGTWALSVEAGYTRRGVYNNHHSSDNYYNINLPLDYADIPLTLYFKDPYGGLTIGAGLVYSRLVQQPHGIIKFRPTWFMPDTSDMTFLKNDLAPAVEVRFNIWQNLMFSFRYQYSIIPVKRNWSFTKGSSTWSNNCYNQSVMVRLLWQFGDDTKGRNTKSGKYNKKKYRR